jgi:glycosyltransferase involved in cell wall biosynthesis
MKKACFAWDHPEIGLKAYEKAKEKYSWRRTIGEIDKLYESIVQ